MNTFFASDFWTTYMLPSAVSLAVFYLLYKAVVRNDVHLKIRRFTILGILVFAMVLPFLNFEITRHVAVDHIGTNNYLPLRDMIYEMPIFTALSEESIMADGTVVYAVRSYEPFKIIGWIYLVFVLFLMGRGFVGILRLATFSRNGKRLPTEDVTIVSSSKIATAFSFFKTVFIPETWENSDEKAMVLAHERVHVSQKHSWDLMLMEAICVVQFFNPFVWLLKREMRLNHEFLADQEALKNNENPEQYFQLLFREIVRKQPIFVHSFYYSPLEHRIMMQLSKPAKMLNQVRYLAFVPIALALTFLFACKENLIFEDVLPLENAEISHVLQMDTLHTEKVMTLEELYTVCENLGADSIVVIFKTGTRDVPRYVSFVYNRLTNELTRSDGKRLSDVRCPQIAEKIPTKDQLESWKNPSEYGIWLDGRRIENSEINKYQPSDFSYYSISRLARNAKDYGKYVYHLVLYTPAYYKEVKARLEADETLFRIMVAEQLPVEAEQGSASEENVTQNISFSEDLYEAVRYMSQNNDGKAVLIVDINAKQIFVYKSELDQIISEDIAGMPFSEALKQTSRRNNTGLMLAQTLSK